ncbi:MAG TPA: molybdopterin-dependent oxidoreductase [Candidatus Baltobacteraceae bacterium]|nr:molybdopterin-dependent oxidoreductase [Candidatus Baltobacteraceae bacterium]
MPTVKSVCPYDCPDACGLLVEVEGGRALKVQGDPDHPYSQGTLCVKMNQYQDTVHSPCRLTTPLLRSGAKGSGDFRPASWPEAIGQIAERWRAILATHGAEAVLPYSYAGTMGLVQRNVGHAFFHRLGASRLERTICSPAKAAGWKAVMGETPGLDPDEAEHSDLIILWGTNAAATNIHFLNRVRRAKQRGAAVWLIETYRTATTPVADQVFLVRPGSDGALALGLMHLLVRDSLADRGFLAAHVQGFADLEAKILPDFPPARVSDLTGLPIVRLEEMAQAYGRARAPLIRIGNGLSRYANGSMNVRCIVCLPAIIGAYGKKGAGCFAGTRTEELFDLATVQRPDFMKTPTRVVNMNCLGQALTELNKPPVQGLYVYCSNPVAVAPDQNQVLKGVLREDLFTVVHERFMTDTARYADVVLPATSSLEHADLYRAYGSYCVQKTVAAIPPVGESKSNWDVFCLLAEAMGFAEPFFRQSGEALLDEMLARSRPRWEKITLDAAALAAGQPVQVRLSPEDRATFATPSGKIEILNPREPEPLPCYLPPHQGHQPLRLMTAPSLYALNSSFRERTVHAKDQMLLRLSPAEAAARGLTDTEEVLAFNDLGEVMFTLQVTPDVPAGVAVADGVFWLDQAPGHRTVNALTSQRLTDRGNGSTFYDNTVEVRKANGG